MFVNLVVLGILTSGITLLCSSISTSIRTKEPRGLSRSHNGLGVSGNNSGISDGIRVIELKMTQAENPFARHDWIREYNTTGDSIQHFLKDGETSASESGGWSKSLHRNISVGIKDSEIRSCQDIGSDYQWTSLSAGVGEIFGHNCVIETEWS